MPKILSDLQKKEMTEFFKKGLSFDELVNKYDLKKPTIIKHLKTLMGEDQYKKILKIEVCDEIKESKTDNQVFNKSGLVDIEKTEDLSNKYIEKENEVKHYPEDNCNSNANFYEIIPLEENFDSEQRKDLTSKPLNDFTIPQNCFLVVDKNNELEIFYLRDFPEYGFLNDDDQKRKIIKLFSDKKAANSFCKKNQKIIKVPNGEVFSLVSSFLIDKGISRIIFDDNLLSI